MSTTCKSILEGLTVHSYDECLSHIYCCDEAYALTAHRERAAAALHLQKHLGHQ